MSTQTKRKKSKNRWLILNNDRHNIDPKLPWFALDSTSNLKALRPHIHGHKEGSRLLKDYVYLLIYAHVKKHKVLGPYLGLAAAYIPEIYQLFRPSIRGPFFTCQLRRADFKKLLEYQPFVAKAYPKADFLLQRSNILDTMHSNPKRFSILDLDFMYMLNEKRIRKIVRAIEVAAKTRAVLAIWHTTNREKGKGDSHIDRVYRPYLRSQLQEKFKVLNYDRVNYWEGYPMKVDIFTLERKSACRKESLKVA